MNATDLNAEVLAQLALGNVVGPQESAKERVVTIVAAIDQPLEAGQAHHDQCEALLARCDPPAIGLLAVLLPVVEYGATHMLSVVSQCVRRIADATALSGHEHSLNRQCGVVLLGRLIWAVSAYALYCRRMDGLAELSRISVRTAYGQRRWEPLIAMRQLRYPSVLGQNAGRAYEDYRQWLQEVDFITDRYALFARDRDASFDEADLLLAMRGALEGGRTYSAALDSNTVHQLADHILDPTCRPGLATTFRCSEDDLNEVLERAFTAVETDQHRFDRPRSIFGGDD